MSHSHSFSIIVEAHCQDDTSNRNGKCQSGRLDCELKVSHKNCSSTTDNDAINKIFFDKDQKCQPNTYRLGCKLKFRNIDCTDDENNLTQHTDDHHNNLRQGMPFRLCFPKGNSFSNLQKLIYQTMSFQITKKNPES